MGKLIKATVLSGILLAIALYIMITTFAPGETPTEQAQNARKIAERQVNKAAVIAKEFAKPAPEGEGTGLADKVKAIKSPPSPSEAAPPTEVEAFVEKPEGQKPKKGAGAPPGAAPSNPLVEPVQPPVAPAPAPKPEPIFHTVLEGEILGTIAEQYLGDSNRWPLIVKANPGIDPDRLRVGQKLVIPPPATDARLAEVTVPVAPVEQPVDKPVRAWKWYTVKPGDTLYGIAAAQLGNGNRYHEILKRNPELEDDADSIQVGQKIRIPQSGERK